MTHRLTLPSICRSRTYILLASDFASYLEDYSMEKCCTGVENLRMHMVVKDQRDLNSST